MKKGSAVKKQKMQMFEQMIGLMQQTETQGPLSSSNLLYSFNSKPMSFAPYPDLNANIKKDSMISLGKLADAGHRDSINRSMMLPKETVLEASEYFEVARNTEKYQSLESDNDTEKYTIKNPSQLNYFINPR